ncbi:MAG: hypothetical protein KAS16_08570 [Thermoplasmata archaeon]|nr:hypothetical protein [Thermoplasmata archaeon]
MMSTRSMSLTLVVFISLTLLALMGPAMVSADDGNVSDIRLHIRGPDLLAHDRVGTYEITIMDPLERSWQYSLWIDANNITGAKPLEIEPMVGNLSAQNKTFVADITAMTPLGDMIMYINVSSPSGALWYVREFDIKVIEPIVIVADILNSGDVVILNATVQFFVDDELLSTDTLRSLDVGASTVMTGEWVTEDIADGWHTSTVLVDVNNDGIIDPTVGDMEIDNKFFVEGSNMSATIYILLGITGLLVGMILINKKLSGKRK